MPTLDDLRATASQLEDEFLDALCTFPFDEALVTATALRVKAADEAVRCVELDLAHIRCFGAKT